MFNKLIKWLKRGKKEPIVIPAVIQELVNANGNKTFNLVELSNDAFKWYISINQEVYQLLSIFIESCIMVNGKRYEYFVDNHYIPTPTYITRRKIKMCDDNDIIAVADIIRGHLADIRRRRSLQVEKGYSPCYSSTSHICEAMRNKWCIECSYRSHCNAGIFLNRSYEYAIPNMVKDMCVIIMKDELWDTVRDDIIDSSIIEFVKNQGFNTDIDTMTKDGIRPYLVKFVTNYCVAYATDDNVYVNINNWSMCNVYRKK